MTFPMLYKACVSSEGIAMCTTTVGFLFRMSIIIHQSSDRNLLAVRFPLQEQLCGAFVSLKLGGN